MMASMVLVTMFVIFVFMGAETARPQQDKYVETSDIPRGPGPETVFVNVPLDWADLEE